MPLFLQERTVCPSLFNGNDKVITIIETESIPNWNWLRFSAAQKLIKITNPEVLCSDNGKIYTSILQNAKQL